MGKYRFGFSITGLVLYALQLLPNILWMLAPPANDMLAANSSPYPIFNILEQVFGILTVVLLVLLINKAGGRNSRRHIALAALFLAGYYIAWSSTIWAWCPHGCSSLASPPCRPCISFSLASG